ncbi:hypothetical protein KAU33_16685 [Candidatus Dependentiae bacterium]|nr:hypothetical protein [Candidatus Dependentiae bacterium]
MSKKIFLGLILTSIIIVSLIALTGCVDPQKNPTIPSYNTFPRLGELTIYPAVISSLSTTTLSVVAKDDDGDDLTITFREEQNRGSFQVTSSTMAIWTAPLAIGSYNIYAKVEDSTGAAVEGYKTLRVINHDPVITGIENKTAFIISDTYIFWPSGNTSTITITAYDVDHPDTSLNFDCQVEKFLDFFTQLELPDTYTYTILPVSSSVSDTSTTNTFLFTMQEDPPYDIDIYFDISVTDNIGNSDTLSYKIQAGD